MLGKGLRVFAVRTIFLKATYVLPFKCNNTPALKDKYNVVISEFAQKKFHKLPLFIKQKFFEWVKQVNQVGLSEVRKIKGYHGRTFSGEQGGATLN